MNAVADPTHLRLFDVQTFKHLCRSLPDRPSWHPLLVTHDDATVFADLVPVKAGQAPADDECLARFFD